MRQYNNLMKNLPNIFIEFYTNKQTINFSIRSPDVKILLHESKEHIQNLIKITKDILKR